MLSVKQSLFSTNVCSFGKIIQSFQSFDCTSVLQPHYMSGSVTYDITAFRKC